VTAPRRVLVIDDDNEVREVARVSLELMAGWQVVAVGSGHEGLAVAATEPLDAILVDVMMPDLDGAAMVTALRAAPLTRDVPVILLTAVMQDDHWHRFAGLGVAGVIAKPFDAIHLADTIATTLG
jgi:CheY-like chemotaxis protein